MTKHVRQHVPSVVPNMHLMFGSAENAQPSVVTLRCEVSPCPGSDYVNSLCFEQGGDKVLVRDAARDPSDGSEYGTQAFTLGGPLTWRQVAEFVGDPEWGGGLSDTGLTGKPSIDGLLQWQSEAGLICWKRYGPAQESIAGDLLSLSDCCVRLSLTYRGWQYVADALVRVSELRAEAAELAGPMARRMGVADDADCLAQLVLRLAGRKRTFSDVGYRP